jgi:NADH-quinone oxidoreductase subunit I
MYLLAIVKGMIITIKHLFTRKVTIQYPEQVREMSPVYRGQHQLKRDEQGRKLYRLWCAVAIRSDNNESGRT